MAFYIGLMSGTSCDGIDAVLVEFVDENFTILATDYFAYPQAFREDLLSLYSRSISGTSMQSADDLLDHIAYCEHYLASYSADLVANLLRKAHIDSSSVEAIGFHGHTLRHRPDSQARAVSTSSFSSSAYKPPYTWQIGDPNLLAELSGIRVVADFRRRDIAAGGHGAPLTSAFHLACFQDYAPCVMVVNIGGIANLTAIHSVALQSQSRSVLGFDTGPGNMLMDAWIARCLNKSFDQGGQWARSGKPIASLLTTMLQEPYFQQPYPKTTGRELFNLLWLDRYLTDNYYQEDVQASLLELTVISIKQAIYQALARFFPGTLTPDLTSLAGKTRIIICGGGAFNDYLLNQLAEVLDPLPLCTSQDYGIAPDKLEALAFAWLARQTLSALPANLPEVTGARGQRVLGAIYA